MLVQALESLKGKTEEIPCVVGDEHVWTKDIRYQLSVSKVSVTYCNLSKLFLHVESERITAGIIS